MTRWSAPIDIRTAVELEAAGFYTVPGVTLYEIVPVREQNPILLRPDEAHLVPYIQAEGYSVAFYEWDAEHGNWLDPVSGNRQLVHSEK